MINKDFLFELFAKGKLETVDPSDDICQAYINKSRSYFSSAKILSENHKHEESVSMSYYSMYYVVLALFFKVGIKSENHTATIQLLKEIFSIDNSKINFAKKERVDKQYYVDFNVTETDAKSLIEIAEKFNSDILDFIAKMQISEEIRYQDKLRNLLK